MTTTKQVGLYYKIPAILFIIFLFTGLILYAFLPDLLKASLIRGVKQYTIFSAEVLRIDLKPFQGKLAVEGLKLFNENQEVLALDNLEIDLDVADLLARKFRVSFLGIYGLTAKLAYRDKQLLIAGKTLDQLILLQEPDDSGSDSFELIESGSTASRWTEIGISKLVFEEIQINLDTVASRNPLELKINKFSARGFDLEQPKSPMDIELDARFNEFPLIISGRLTPLALDQKQVVSMNVKGWNLEKLKDDLKGFDFKLPEFKGSISLGLSGELRVLDDGVALHCQTSGVASGLNLQLGGSHIQLSNMSWAVPILDYVHQDLSHLELKEFQLQNVKVTSTGSSGQEQGLAIKKTDLSDLILNNSVYLKVSLEKLSLENLEPLDANQVAKTRPSNSMVQLNHLMLEQKEKEIQLNTGFGRNGRISFTRSISPGATNKRDILLTIDALNLVDLGPLLANQIGYEIRSGLLASDLRAKENDKGEIRGKLKIDLNSLKLADSNQKGETFERKLNVPLSTTLMMLEDSDGKIEMEFDVSGNLDGPELNPITFLSQTLGMLILEEVGKKAGNALVTMYLPMLATSVMSPAMAYALVDKSYNFLTKLRFKPLNFAPGTASLEPDAKKQLAVIAKILRQQRKVSLKLCSPANPMELWTLNNPQKADPKTGKFPKVPKPELEPYNQPILDLAFRRLSVIEEDLVKTENVAPNQLVTCQPELGDGDFAIVEVSH